MVLKEAQDKYARMNKALPVPISDLWNCHRQDMASAILKFQSVEEVILWAQASGHTATPGGSGFDHRIVFNPALIQTKIEALLARFPSHSLSTLLGLGESTLSHPDSLGIIEGHVLSNVFLWHLNAYLACMTFIPPPHSVLEIGGGYGGLARIFALKGVDYTIIDMPETLFFAEVFLRANGIEGVKLLRIGDPLGIYDLAINQGGFGEMPQQTVDYWAEILKGRIKHVYSLNYHKEGPNFTGAEFRGWKVIREEVDPPPIMGDVQGTWLEAIYAL